MRVFKNPDEIPAYRNAVITIGTFDGVHSGHKKIIDQMLSEAARADGETVLISFFPHPRMVLQSDKKPIQILNEQEEKYKLLEKCGIENIVVVPFEASFAKMSAGEYIKDFLVAKFHPKVIIVGYDHRFGNNRDGDFNLLSAMAEEYNYEVKEIPKQVLKDLSISSTKVREALLEGRSEDAEHLLGYPYFFSGVVIEGNKLGRTIGYPTANIKLQDPHKLVPGNGVYAVSVQLDDRIFQGMMNIGVRPTVDGANRVIEVNIFDFDEDIYGKRLTISLKRKLRDEIKFSGLDELKAQLAKDKEAAVKDDRW